MRHWWKYRNFEIWTCLKNLLSHRIMVYEIKYLNCSVIKVHNKLFCYIFYCKGLKNNGNQNLMLMNIFHCLTKIESINSQSKTSKNWYMTQSYFELSDKLNMHKWINRHISSVEICILIKWIIKYEWHYKIKSKLLIKYKI